VADEHQTFDVPLGRLLNVAPGMPTTDMARTVEHYGRLGFTFSAPGSPSPAEAEFTIGQRDGIALHFALKPEHDPATTATWVFIGVEDADEMGAELTAAGMDQGRPVRTTDYKMRQIAHIDPDGNLLLFGSPLPPHSQDPATREAAEKPAQAGVPRTLPDGDRAAFELLRAVKRGDAEQLNRILGVDPGLASSWTGGCTPLHHFADAPGHRPNAAAVVDALVAAGADLNAHVRDSWHHETPLHWAASNDDVVLIDALLDAGADIEHPGSSIDGGPPIQSALGYAQWAAVRRLWERGAETGLSHAAALGLTETVTSLVETSQPPPDRDDVSVAFWNACRAGQLPVARYLLARGADLNWQAPWDGNTPLDAATAKHQRQTAAWLRDNGAHSGKQDLRRPDGTGGCQWGRDRVRGHRARPAGGAAARLPRLRSTLAPPGTGAGRGWVSGDSPRSARLRPVR
jgi:ankyrin repeat protein